VLGTPSPAERVAFMLHVALRADQTAVQIGAAGGEQRQPPAAWWRKVALRKVEASMPSCSVTARTKFAWPDPNRARGYGRHDTGALLTGVYPG
jgi:hypothetical protein